MERPFTIYGYSQFSKYQRIFRPLFISQIILALVAAILLFFFKRHPAGSGDSFSTFTWTCLIIFFLIYPALGLRLSKPFQFIQVEEQQFTYRLSILRPKKIAWSEVSSIHISWSQISFTLKDGRKKNIEYLDFDRSQVQGLKEMLSSVAGSKNIPVQVAGH